MKLCAFKFWFLKTDRGVTMAEFALVLPLLLVLIIGIIDVSRYFAYQAILNKGAENGLNFALKVPNLDVDLKDYKPGDIDYQRYLQARQLVAIKAREVPLKTFFSDSTTDSVAKLVNYTYEDPDLSVTPATNVERNEEVGLIFPGETIVAEKGTSYEAQVPHKTLPTPPTVQTKAELLKIHPVMVELRAEVKPLTPFLKPITMRAIALGYREEVPRGPLTGEFGLVDPTSSSSSSASSGSSSSSSSAGLPLPPRPSTTDLNWADCARQTNDKCPNGNDPGGNPCVPCAPNSNSGLSNLGF